MKELIKIYKNEFVEFLKNKKFVILLILVVALGYGFRLTNVTIGVDDLSLDRYVDDTFILSQGRWGTFLIYNIFRINEYAPFWLDFLTLIILVVTAIFLAVFFKRVSNSNLKNSSYIIFALAYISFPVISYFFVYQPTKLTVAFSNLLICISIAILYENFVKENKINLKQDLLIGIIVMFAVSMYESCAQTFLSLIFITSFIYIFFNNKNAKFKEILNFYINCFLSLLAGVVFYYITKAIILNILDLLNLRKESFAYNKSIIPYLTEAVSFKNCLYALDLKYSDFFSNKMALYFCIICMIGLILSIASSIKRKNVKIFLNYIFAFISNLVLICYIAANLFRICYSWTIMIGFVFLYLNEIFKTKTKKSVIVTIILSYLILTQTKWINQIFYNEYLEYQRVCLYLENTMSRVLEIDDDLSKPILFLDNGGDFKKVLSEIKEDYIFWGIDSFNEHGTEIKKFLNNMGYNVKLVDDYEKSFEYYLDNVTYEENKQDIIELEDFIIVKINTD